ncbi:MAG: 16S rRNA (cytidine(1402)-2'-O)-methyltransferase [Bacillota bacterium]
MSEPGTLYVCATPIGNLEDASPRLIRTLSESQVVAAEDTRRVLKLLNHFGIKKPIVSYWKHREKQACEKLLQLLLDGESVALVSDAGTPLVSDPGYELVKAALSKGVNVVHIPGPCAAIAALVVSGLPTDSFVFEGFLPRKKSTRRKALERLRDERRTVVLFEAPHRVLDTLKDIVELLGDPYLAVARELTKVHEEVLRGKASEVLQRLGQQQVKGEITIVMSLVSKAWPESPCNTDA